LVQLLGAGLTPIDQCLPGTFKFHSTEVSWFWGLGMPKIQGIFFFSGIYAKIYPIRQIGYKKMNLLKVKLMERGSQNHF
jgi:hypothetical protein